MYMLHRIHGRQGAINPRHIFLAGGVGATLAVTLYGLSECGSNQWFPLGYQTLMWMVFVSWLTAWVLWWAYSLECQGAK